LDFHLDPNGDLKVRIDSYRGYKIRPKSSSYDVRDGKWHHCAATQDNKANKINLLSMGQGVGNLSRKYENSGGFLKFALGVVGSVNFTGCNR